MQKIIMLKIGRLWYPDWHHSAKLYRMSLAVKLLALQLHMSEVTGCNLSPDAASVD
jgi:hypothetical protein